MEATLIVVNPRKGSSEQLKRTDVPAENSCVPTNLSAKSSFNPPFSAANIFSVHSLIVELGSLNTNSSEMKSLDVAVEKFFGSEEASCNDLHL